MESKFVGRDQEFGLERLHLRAQLGIRVMTSSRLIDVKSLEFICKIVAEDRKLVVICI